MQNELNVKQVYGKTWDLKTEINPKVSENPHSFEQGIRPKTTVFKFEKRANGLLQLPRHPTSK